MNLVAKEYVAAQDSDDPGVLVLSRFAGAARQMSDAVIVNPFSHEEVSEGIKRALTMERGERIARWRRLMDGVAGSDVNIWRDSFVAALSDAHEPELPLFTSQFRSANSGSNAEYIRDGYNDPLTSTSSESDLSDTYRDIEDEISQLQTHML
jgi:trehalose-6-phosphate synthase